MLDAHALDGELSTAGGQAVEFADVGAGERPAAGHPVPGGHYVIQVELGVEGRPHDAEPGLEAVDTGREAGRKVMVDDVRGEDLAERVLVLRVEGRNEAVQDVGVGGSAYGIGLHVCPANFLTQDRIVTEAGGVAVLRRALNGQSWPGCPIPAGASGPAF